TPFTPGRGPVLTNQLFSMEETALPLWTEDLQEMNTSTSSRRDTTIILGQMTLPAMKVRPNRSLRSSNLRANDLRIWRRAMSGRKIALVNGANKSIGFAVARQLGVLRGNHRLNWSRAGGSRCPSH